MKRANVWKIILIAISFASLAGATAADTLELKDGRLVHGKYVGGSENNIRFLINGGVQYFPVKEIVTLSFDSSYHSGASFPASSSGPSSSAAPSDAITVPAGTTMMIRMIDAVDSSTDKAGKIFHASLEEDLTVGDLVVARKGADVYGRLEQAKSAGDLSGSSELRLALTGIMINGNVVPVQTSDYDVAGKSRGKQSAERIGGGAVLGAIIGGIAGGGKGAGIGAGVGAGAGTAVQVMTHGQQVRVPSETLLEFRLAQPLYVTSATG